MNAEKYSLVKSVLNMVDIRSTIYLLFLISISHVASAQNGSGAGVYPTRIVIPSGERSGSVTLTNSSSVEVAYRMTMVEMGLNSEGRFAELSAEELPENHSSATSIVRFSPRQVRLKPGQSQVVRAIVMRGRMKQAGEYRSHLKLQALPVLSDNLEKNLRDPVLVNAAAGINVGVSIPVIVRKGVTDAQASVQQVTLNTDNTSGKVRSVSMLMGLTGNRSAFGDFTVYLSNGKKEIKIARMKNWALYYPYSQETVSIPVSAELVSTDINANTKVRVYFSNKAIDSSKKYWADQVLTPVIN